jgi:murein DD-endopeptidase MepM/ murein hydrolase activator NlpD
MNWFGSTQGRTLLGVGGIFTVGFLAVGTPRPTPEVGVLDPIVAVPSERFEVRVLGRGETFGAVLAEAALDGNEQQLLLEAFREQASPRRMQAGTEIILRRQRSDGVLRALDISLNRDETVRLVRDESAGWRSEKVEVPVVVDTVATSGMIRSVLWTSILTDPELEAMERNDRIRLIDQMDRIFQWKIDFTRQIQPGDIYRVVYERQVRPDGSTRAGTVLAAEIVNGGRSVVALFFDPDGNGDGTYYDLDGNSVRRSFLRRPVEFSRITSRVGTRRHPILNTIRNHNGVDFAAPTGTPVYATADGTVTFRGVSGGYGNMVEIRHANGFTSRYAHLNSFASGMTVGSRVRQEQVIGTVGMTGLATGPHVHYELRRSGRVLDPLSVDLPAGDPIPQDAWSQWEAQRSDRLGLLEVRTGFAPEFRVASSGTSVAASGEGEQQ